MEKSFSNVNEQERQVMYSSTHLQSKLLENLKRVQHEIGEAVIQYNREADGVRLMAVTKTVPPEDVNLAIEHGVTLLGENKAQELLAKYDVYDKNGVDIHFIGHLQSNKVKQIMGKVRMIQSVDRLSLAKEISAQAEKHGCHMEVLVEVNIGDEESKSGTRPEEVEELLHQISVLPHVKVKGLMTIPPICDKMQQTERFFYAMRELLVDMRAKNIDNVSMDILSMGMSGDYVPAIKHGSNIIRIGTAIFGSRNYT